MCFRLCKLINTSSPWMCYIQQLKSWNDHVCQFVWTGAKVTFYFLSLWRNMYWIFYCGQSKAVFFLKRICGSYINEKKVLTYQCFNVNFALKSLLPHMCSLMTNLRVCPFDTDGLTHVTEKFESLENVSRYTYK